MKLNEKKERKINGVMWYFWLINDYGNILFIYYCIGIDLIRVDYVDYLNNINDDFE